ncbi:MAG: hypothetical protein H6719_06085 [Sandaracinaceae bacterium]|nr:hypothetical protein [Sandaracinaceae bacterium]
MHKTFGAALVLLALGPGTASAQLMLSDSQPLDVSTSRPELATPGWVEELETTTAIPPCGDRASWGRSTLDGGLASRRRPESLPCRSIFDNPIRFELGVVVGGLTDRGEGALGGFSAQLGLRYHELFSVYWQLQVLGGGWSRGGGTTVDATVWNSVMLEFSPHRNFAVALGPAFDITAGCDMNVDQQSSCWYAWSYGVATRITVPLAQVDSTGFVATGDFHVSLIEPEPRATAVLGLGFRM